MRSIRQTEAPKRAVNLSLNSELLRHGKALGLNLSSVAEEALAQAVSRGLAARWLEENRAAMETYNRRIETLGVFSDDLRSF